MARVLIVDDDDSQRLLNRTIMQKSGHEIFLARSGEEALKVCLRKAIDIVLTDLEMTGGDGFELIQAIAGLTPPITIIALSGKGPAMLEKARELGAEVTLSKPITPKTLLAAVESVAG